MPDCCVQVRELIKRASTLLNDDVVDLEYVRWPKATLLDYLNEAIGTLSSHRPDLFTECVELSLSAGSKQKLPNQYMTLVSLDYSIDADGVPTPITEANTQYARYFKGGCADKSGECSTPVWAGVASFSKISQDPKQFFVYPTVPRRTEAVVMATVVKRPCAYCMSDLDDCIDIPPGQQAALVDWMLHRAYGTDIESEYAFRASAAALARFRDNIATTYLQESRFDSGYYRGKEGEGDPNTTPRSRI